MKPLKILFSAYACEPGKGSEPGIGWRWPLEAARLGHDVWVITRRNNAESIERALATVEPGLKLRFLYFDLPPSLRWWKRGGRGVHLYYALWQRGSYRQAARLHQAQAFDAVHYITFGVSRHANPMGGLGVPFILGPLGGGESVPSPLRRHFGLRGKIVDAARDLANRLALVNPAVRAMYARADLILCRTPQTRDWLPKEYQAKAHCMLEIGLDVRAKYADPVSSPESSASAIRFLYVGRFLYLKGMGLGLPAFAQLCARGVNATLTLIGQGPERERWEALARSLGVADRLHWVPWMRQEELMKAYGTYDAMLFPSLRDSGANVVLEALAAGLPVVCVGLGGPAESVRPSCGRVVGVEGRSEAEVIGALADAMAELARDPELLGQLRKGALERAVDYDWRRVVGRVWGADGLGCRAVAAHRAPSEIGLAARTEGAG